MVAWAPGAWSVAVAMMSYTPGALFWPGLSGVVSFPLVSSVQMPVVLSSTTPVVSVKIWPPEPTCTRAEMFTSRGEAGV